MMQLNPNFRVLALSATPGSGQREIQNVIYNLKISHIEIRSEDDPEIAQYSHDKLVRVNRNSFFVIIYFLLLITLIRTRLD